MSSNTRAELSASVLKSGSGPDVPEPEAAATKASAKLDRHIRTVIEAEHHHKRGRPISNRGSGLLTQPVAPQRLPLQSAFHEGLGGGGQAEVEAGAGPSGDGAGGPRAGLGCTSSVKHVRFAEYLEGQGQKGHHLGMVHAAQGVQRSVFKSVHTQVATQSSGDGGSTAPGARNVAAANSTNGDSESAGGAAGAAGGLNRRLERFLLDAFSGQRHQASGLGSDAVRGAAGGTAGPTAAGPAGGHPATDTTRGPRGSLHNNCSSGAIPGGGVGPAEAAGGRNAHLVQLLLGALSGQQHQAARLSCGTLSNAASTVGALVTNNVPRSAVASAIKQVLAGAGAAGAPGTGSGPKRRKSSSAAAAAADDGQLETAAGAAGAPGTGSGRKRRKSSSVAAAAADDGQLETAAGAAGAPGTGSGRKRRKSSSVAAAAAGVPITKATRARTSRASRQMQCLSSLLWKPGAEDSDRFTDSSESSDENEADDDDDKNDDTCDDEDDDDEDDNDDEDDDNEGVAFNNEDDNDEAGEDEGEEVNKDDLQTLANILHEALGGMMEFDWNSDGDWLRNLGSDDEGVEDDKYADVDDSDFEERTELKEKVTEKISKGEEGTEEEEGREGKCSEEPGNGDGGVDADVRGSAEPTQTVPNGQAPERRRFYRISWRSVRRKRWRHKAEEYKKRLPGGCLPGAPTPGVLMNNEELWDARLLAKSCLVIEEQPEIRDRRLLCKRLPDDLTPKWTQLDEGVDTELKLSQAMAAGAPLLPRKYPRPHSPTVAPAAADGTESRREIMAGGWLLPYDTGSTPYWSGRAAPQLDPGARRGAVAGMGDACDKDNATDSGGVGGAVRNGSTHFGFRIKGHSSLRGISVQEARARAARLYRTGSSGKLSSDSSSSITTSRGDDSSSCSSGSDAMADVDGEAAAALMAAEEGGEGFGAGICGSHLSVRAGLRTSARVRKVDELLAVPDPECDDDVNPADDVRLETANTAFFDGYFWEQSRTVQKQYDYTVRDGPSTSRPNSQGVGSRRRWRFAHWELTLRCTHPECGAEKLIHLPAAVPGRLTLEQLAASGLRVWVLRPGGYRGEHNHAPPGGGGVLRWSGRPLSELHRLVPEGLQADIPLATMLPIPLPQSALPGPQQLPATEPNESAANATEAANASCYGGIPPSFHSVPPSQRAAAAIWLLEPPPPPVWKCRGWTLKAREPGGSPQLAMCSAINRAGDGAQGNTGVSGTSGSAGKGSTGSSLRYSCASCGACRPDGRHGMLRQLVNAALDQHDPASVTPLQLHEHVAKATAISGVGATTVTMFSLPEVTADAFVVLMQRVARALLHHHLPPLLPSPPPPSIPLLLPSPLRDNNNVDVQDTVVKPIVEAVFKSGAWSWPGIILLHADLGACPPDVAAISAARALGGYRALKVVRKDIIEDPERFVMVDGDRMDLQRAAGVLGVAGGSGGGGSGPPVVEVEEVGDWRMPLAFRQLHRRIAETYNVNVTTKALAEEVAAEAAGAQAASGATTRAADEAAPPCSDQGSEMQQAQTSRASKAAEGASHAVMALLGSLESGKLQTGDLIHPQKSVWRRPDVILGDPYGRSRSGDPFTDGAVASQRTIFLGGSRSGAIGVNDSGADGDAGLKASETGSARPKPGNGSGFAPGPTGPRLPLDTVQLLHAELQKHCPQVGKLVAPLVPCAELPTGGHAAAELCGNAGHSNAVAGGHGVTTAGGGAQPVVYVARRKDALAWDDPEAMQPSLELCGPAVRVRSSDADGLRDHPIGMPYMYSVLSKRRKLDPEPVVVGAGSSDRGAYNLGRQEWFHHCLRQQQHPECEIFGGPVGQHAGIQLHATGPLHWLPKAAQQQAEAEAAAAVVLQASAAANTSPESLAAMFRSAVNQSDRHHDSGAAADDISVSATATTAAAGAQLDLLSVSLLRPPAELELAATATASSIGHRIPAAVAVGIKLAPAAAATMYHANIALARSSMTPPVIRPIFHRRGIPPSTISLIVQFSIAWASRQRAALLPAHVAMSKHRRKKSPRPPEHPPWALGSTAMGDPWDIDGIASAQQASSEDGQWYDANGSGNRGGSKLTQRILSAAADAVEANSGLGTSARDGGSSPGYAWRPWVPATGRQAPRSKHSQRAPRHPMTATGVEGHRAEVSNSHIPGAGQKKLMAGSQHGSAAATGATAAAIGAGSGVSARSSGTAQAADECSPLPPSIVMVEELTRRSIFSGRPDLSVRAQARFRAVLLQMGRASSRGPAGLG
ncbi:hypothetical protein VaNZ11_006164 [Volvox africanus]|uniref:Uncharacterized protein n=1 Tax=Volvox africanus TaxID=51714 RepID=A0ABQ5S1W5_9CHLO|nr:hypothetical protein VaNZ11_006164 [Volvox africanus]